jgi:5'-nucleotidase (lipoprotein e(P4) family)
MRIALCFVLIAAACAPPAATITPPPPGPAGPPADSALAVPSSIHWFRNAAEYRALALQVFRQATEQVTRQAAGLPRGSWAVILDGDETVLDNSEYQRRNALRGTSFNAQSWHAWVREQATPAIPGAAEFTQGVQRLGGRVAIVTGRDQVVCPETEANLRAVGIGVDIVLCRADPANSDKNPRFRAVAEGTTPAGLPPLRVIAWLGDNIRDFPGLDQSARADALQLFGTRYFMLPNPMYGSWESLPRR